VRGLEKEPLQFLFIINDARIFYSCHFLPAASLANYPFSLNV